MTKSQWKFSDLPNTAVIVNRKIVYEKEWIAYVSHDNDDGAWQFHTNQPGVAFEKDAILVSLKAIVCLDPTITLLADLPLGWHAWRHSKNEPWIKEMIAK
ncbi:hypothetical protein RI049_10725 [Cedecea neteri]|uniref:hypothetical protein n=1 Tax=Cedecea neteri TaxID=158822 RepID=UPI0005DA4418|nr:hypothetical protein [Cedecea neteri]AJZ89762.1 hypothetical protein VW41_12305 [Klebsiella michiganensis]WPU25176.1 hypothetical protein RI049_10725 [Cedecea neteri]